MGKFLERHTLQKLTQEETENRNRPITSKKTEQAIKKIFLERKAQDQIGCTGTKHLTKN